jgi:hypothetical protein
MLAEGERRVGVRPGRPLLQRQHARGPCHGGATRHPRGLSPLAAPSRPRRIR